jgi:hypothetical protein
VEAQVNKEVLKINKQVAGVGIGLNLFSAFLNAALGNTAWTVLGLAGAAVSALTLTVLWRMTDGEDE